MIAYALAIVGLVSFVQWPVLGALAFLGGAWLAERSNPRSGELFELLVFYAVILSVGCAFAGIV